VSRSAPISKVVGFLPANIPRILINRTIVHPQSSTPDSHSPKSRDAEGSVVDDGAKPSDPSERDFRDNYVFDAYLLGYCDDVTRALGRRLFFPSGDSNTQSTVRGDDEEDGKLLACLEDDGTHRKQDWTHSKISSKIPPERIFLFPGAVSPVSASSSVGAIKGDNIDDDASTSRYCEIAHCDGCAARVTQGTIHKCAVCFDYDLCQSCFACLSKDHHGGLHPFVPEPVATG
jgi:hypothetical protein